MRTKEVLEFEAIMSGVDPELFFAESIPEPNSGCFLWEAGKRVNQNYPRLSGRVAKRGSKVNLERLLAHRVAWVLKNKAPIPEGKLICHRCDITICSNPDHLFAGTFSENRQDCYDKGRANRRGPGCYSRIFS